MATSESVKPTYEIFAEQVTAGLEQGTEPFVKPWSGGLYHLPRNPASGTLYQGINRLMLSRYGYADPRWVTFKQANEAGCCVQKGEKSQPIVYWQWDKEVAVLDAKGKPVLGDDGKPVKETVQLERPRRRHYSIFHISQLAGDIPPFDATKEIPTWDRHERAAAILKGSGAIIKHDQRDRAFYRGSSDDIHLPLQGSFDSADKYYATALHELMHWSGHSSRMNREMGPFGSEQYAREELRAEIASWMLGMELGIGHDPSQHLSYVGSWVKVLQKDPYEIVRACRDAEKMKDYVLAMEQKQELHQGQDVSAPSRDIDVAPDIAKGKTYLYVPFAEKNQARAAGAKWDREAKLWFAPEGADLAKLQTWRTEKIPVPVRTMDPQEEFAHALRTARLDLDGQVPIMDGKMHRVPTLDGKPGSLDGAYVGHLDGHPAGWFENHKTGEQTKWKASGHTLTEEQKTALKAEAAERVRQREYDLHVEQDRVAHECAQLFSERHLASSEHAYLAKKGIPPLGDIKESRTGDRLLVPLYNAAGELRNVQEITPDGGKHFQAGGEKKGCFFMLGPKGQDEILLAEGYATAVSVHMATGLPVAVAFDAGNLEPVAKSIRALYPEAKIAICADNDHKHARGNIGIEKATLAAQAIGGGVIAPSFTCDEMEKGLTDFNDLHQVRGLEAVKSQMLQILETQKSHGIER